MADNGYLTGLSGCRLYVGGSAATSGSIVSLTTPPPYYLDADIIITSGGSIGLSTTFPTDLTAAYQTFINDKQQAITSGGSCHYAGNEYIIAGSDLTSGYLEIRHKSLMTLNGVNASIEPSSEDGEEDYKKLSNINIIPTMGFWAETYNTTPSGTTTTLLRTRKPCGSCEDYNALAVFEMMLYHAINRMAWRILRLPGVGTGLDALPGLWGQYQGMLGRWNAKAFSAQYIWESAMSGDTFSIKIGWINNTCTAVPAFVAYATITLTTSSDLARYRLIYGGSPVAPSKLRNSAVAFVANVDVKKIYLYSNYSTSDATDVQTLFASCMTAAGVTMFSGYTYASSIQDFNVGDDQEGENTPSNSANTGNWIIGVTCKDVGGNDYGAAGFQLGFAQEIDDDIETDSVNKWTYAAAGNWTFGASDVKNYTRTSENLYVDGIKLAEQ